MGVRTRNREQERQKLRRGGQGAFQVRQGGLCEQGKQGDPQCPRRRMHVCTHVVLKVLPLPEFYSNCL